MRNLSRPLPEPLNRRFRVLFGHQSVGQNILDGVAEACCAVPTILPIEFDRECPDSEGFALAHLQIGRNGDPGSKIEHFRTLCCSPTLPPIDLALFKFCYVDVTSATRVEELYEQYSGALAQLIESQPHIRFGHITVPLRAVPPRWKLHLKSSARREETNNRARHRFNHMLLSRYGQGGLVFDLAGVEAGLMEGVTDTRSCSSPPALQNRYTNDGGHLNTRGRRIVARAFFNFIDSVRRRCLS